MPIFQDDPDAIPKLETKLAQLEKEKEYWKGLKPEKRTYQNETDNMKRSYMLPLVNQNIRSVKKKIEQIRARQESGKELERNVTFKNGRKVFFYTEKDKEIQAKNGFMGLINNKTNFVVGEGNKKEFVSVKPKNNFDFFSVPNTKMQMGNFDFFSAPKKKKGKSNNIFDMGF